MGITQRKYQHRKDLLSKSLKRPLKLTAQTLSLDFSDELFYERFKELFPNQWEAINDFYIDTKILNENRRQRGLREVPSIPAPQKYLECRSKAIIGNRRAELKKHGEQENREKLYAELLLKANQVRLKTEQKEKEQYAIQHLQPEGFDMLQTEYFALRKKDPLNVDERLRILLDIAKYKCVETIKFLKRVQNCERNNKLQDYAYLSLISMHAPNIWLHRRYNGKQKYAYNLEPEKAKNPQELLKEITHSKWQKKMKKDIFISHRSIDKDLINELIKLLNQQGFDCYVDWMYDKDQMPRELTCAETAAVLIERMKQSKALLYVLTEESLSSIWMPWELGYFTALDRPIYTYNIIDKDKIPEYARLYPEVKIQDGQLVLLEEGNYIQLTKKQNK